MLIPTRIVSGRADRVFRLPPSESRWKERSRTYEGIAAAMADQWGARSLKGNEMPENTNPQSAPDWVEGAHADIRGALGLDGAAPRRFDFYAAKIADLRAERDEWRAAVKCLLRLREDVHAES